MKKILLIILFIALCRFSYSQFTEFHPELNWYTIKGKYVQVHYHEGAERTAKVVCKIGDEVWEPITSLYQYDPGTVHYVIKDVDDYSNGATYFFDNKIEIWASALDFDLRGDHNWLRNVISHEFTHMVQIQASLKTTRKIPAVYLQWLNYEDERRPDILYGFPNIIASYPIAFLNMPAWFAEGTAQYMRKEFDYDRWDSHRDMILRSYILDGNMLTWNQMGVFEKTSLGNESVYNSGFALTSYIAQKYGEASIREITKKLGSLTNFTIDAAFEDVIGKDGIEIYNEWQNFLKEDYTKRISAVKENLVIGDTIASIGFGNFYPIFIKDGSEVIYISNKNGSYFSPSSIYHYNRKTKEEKLIQFGINSTISMIPNTNKIVYSKISEDNPNSYNIHDLYIYDMTEEEETRITFNMRANQPQVSHDGKSIVYLFQKDGTTNLGMVDVDGKNFRQLTFYQNGEQVYNPKFSKDDSYVVYDYSYHQNRDIAKVNIDGSDNKFLIQTIDDERNPAFDKEGNLIFSSDRTGIYNLYKINLTTKEEVQLTNVTGGAFMPSVDDNGNIVYAGYISTGYKIFYLPGNAKSVQQGKNYIRRKNPPLDESKPNGDIEKFEITKIKNFDDYTLPDYKAEKYSGAFSSLTFFPFIRYDNYNTSNKFGEKIKPGLYITSSDMLNRYSFFGGASINSRWERDLFLIFEYKNKLPGLFQLGIKPEMSLELYNISRKANVDILFDDLPSVQTNITYSLFEFDIVAKHRFLSHGSNIELRYTYSRYTAEIGSFVFPGTTDLYPTNYDTYLIGSNFQFKYTFDTKSRYIDDEINPLGAEIELKYNFELNEFNKDGNYTVEDGILKPQYDNFNFHRLEINSHYHLNLIASHTITTKIRAGTIFGPSVPDFFDFYLGGLIGMKAYPFYAINGNEIFYLNLTYRFPLWRNIDSRIAHLYVDKIFFSVYGDFGNAWNNKETKLNQFKKGAGAELRVALNSFYLFPTSIFFNASYGFDKFSRTAREKTVTYGKEWRYYAGVLFGFDF
jgi:Tol biopolymer transport system component